MDNIKKYPLFINGNAKEPSSGEYAKVYNPGNKEIIALIAKATKTDVEDAILSAKNALHSK